MWDIASARDWRAGDGLQAVSSICRWDWPWPTLPLSAWRTPLGLRLGMIGGPARSSIAPVCLARCPPSTAAMPRPAATPSRRSAIPFPRFRHRGLSILLGPTSGCPVLTAASSLRRKRGDWARVRGVCEVDIGRRGHISSGGDGARCSHAIGMSLSFRGSSPGNPPVAGVAARQGRAWRRGYGRRWMRHWNDGATVWRGDARHAVQPRGEGRLQVTWPSAWVVRIRIIQRWPAHLFDADPIPDRSALPVPSPRPGGGNASHPPFPVPRKSHPHHLWLQLRTDSWPT
jgi:hypothetical protein